MHSVLETRFPTGEHCQQQNFSWEKRRTQSRASDSEEGWISSHQPHLKLIRSLGSYITVLSSTVLIEFFHQALMETWGTFWGFSSTVSCASFVPCSRSVSQLLCTCKMSKNRGYGDRCSTQDPRFLTVHPAEIPLRNTVSDPASEAL